ncbi:nf-kappa-b inhibitor zeta-like [Limosa lapponica baueri]|uniref:Nf-kappa-b inhibitor zeta-like n=1 Tax=Limosa lapponica baueri TaxID=1758121 RepID=A0A2I0U7S3_LIMLA|nr:nf-kappa-b inhibitor zeta-like [Limosa lapponica baueri]
MSAPTDSGLSSDPPQKRYMGVRVKMPVRELLRKIRLSKGLDPAHSKDTSCLISLPHLPPSPFLLLFQSKQSVGQTLKGLEDLDILVEVLQEDLNKSQLQKESLHSVPDGFWQGFSSDLQASRWETGGNKQAAGGLQERCHSFTKLRSYGCFKDSNSVLRGEAETSFLDDQKNTQEFNPTGIFSRTSEKETSWWIQDACTSTQKDFPRHSSQNTSPHSNSSGGCSEDPSAISFFQFQLHREESLLRNIPVDKLLAPDENGNRLLHKAVAQGRRALTYALAQRFASLNKINEKDAKKRTALHLAAEKNQHLMVSDLISLGANVNEQDSLGKTPLHLCAENGYLRVLEVLKNCKDNGVCVEVDLTDHYGLTPLHCAALAHTVLVTESQKADIDTDMGRFLRLRKDQILEGINCLLQMGGKPELQVPNSCQITTTHLKIEENTELMCLLQTHKTKGQNILQEGYSLPDALRRMPSPLSPDNFSELFSMSPSDVFDTTLKACLVTTGNLNFKMMRTVKVEFTAKEENRICQFVQQVCTVPRDYQGYDKVLGLCICQTDSLECVCNSQCRRQQRDTLQITCTEKNAQLFITFRNGSKTAVVLEELRTVLLRPYFSLKDVCTSEQSKYTHPTYIVKMSVKSGHEEHRSSQVQSGRPSNSTSKIIFTGILNPTTCINVNVTIMFIVSKEHYPVYDVNNLYNTNAEFDWGDLRRLREEVKTMYHKLTSEISSLKNLWIKTLSIPEEMEAYASTVTEAYLKAKQQAEEEMQQRKELAAEYEESVNKQMQLLQHDLKCQEEHCVKFNSALREVVRLAEMLTNKVACKGNQTTLSQPDYTSLLAQIEAASSKMSSMIIKESHRLKAWGVLDEGMGAHLLNKAKSRILTKQELVDSNGTALTPDVVCMDPVTGLLTPYPHRTMLLTSQCPGPVPSNYFLHPETGKVLHVAGNVGYDPIRSRLVCAVDSASGKRHKPEVPIFPYIPYPICSNTGLPVKTKLPVLCPEKVFCMGGLMLDPATQIEVPVLGVTIHPHTGQKLTVGGTYLNPLTGMLTPLEIGGPMTDPEGGKIVPILGVGLDSNTGEVIPLGGLVGPSGNLMLLGHSFTEPLSGKIARVHGGHLQRDEVLPHSGSYQAVLEADWLVSQTHVVNAIKQFKASVLEDTCLAADRLAALKASVEDMKQSFTTRFYHALHRLQSLEKKQEIASSLKSNGGKLGMIKYPGTEMWIPAVFGMKIPDPGGSGLMVPILGIDWDWNTRQPSPLAGTMEDSNGKGLVPITIGARTISPITGETGPVIGAQTNPWTHNVIPIVQSLGALPRRASDTELIKYKEKVKDIEEMRDFLKDSSLQEAERRTSKYFSNWLATELSLLFKADRDEKEQEIHFLLEIRQALEKLMEFIEKMRLEEERIYMQLIETEKQRSHISSTETVTNLKLRKVILALVSESQECILKQQAGVETAYTKLEYLRDLSNIQTQQAKSPSFKVPWKVSLSSSALPFP